MTLDGKMFYFTSVATIRQLVEVFYNGRRKRNNLIGLHITAEFFNALLIERDMSERKKEMNVRKS
jgi:hypothetical protein